MTAITLNLNPIIHLTDEQFYQLCQANRDVRFERTASCELKVKPPTGGKTGTVIPSLISVWQIGQMQMVLELPSTPAQVSSSPTAQIAPLMLPGLGQIRPLESHDPRATPEIPTAST